MPIPDSMPLGYRIARAGRMFRNVRGWRRLASVLAPGSAKGKFRVRNGGTVFEGDIGSFIEREIYLYGGYERDMIDLFLSRCAGRRGVVLDIGANVGNHSLAFSRHFAEVHAFEINPSLWPIFERNVALNGIGNIRLHKVGLGSAAAELAFYNITNGNEGLATFASTEQYDRPLQQAGTAKVVAGDDYLASLDVAKVDAIKIDVQGFEQEVFRGLAKTLARDRPIVWFECAGLEGLSTVSQVAAALSYPMDLYSMKAVNAGPFHRLSFERVTSERLAYGDYVAFAAG